MRHTFLGSATQSCVVVIFLLFLSASNALGQGPNLFFAPPTFPGTGQALSADVNGDGKPDIFVAGPLNQRSVLLGNGDGTFRTAVTTSIPAPISTFVVGDLNGDGKPDVLTGDKTYIGKGVGTFATGISSNAIDASFGDSFADFNGDGKLDLCIVGQGVQLGNGNGTFHALLPFSSGALPTSATLGDFDGDGNLDVYATGGTA